MKRIYGYLAVISFTLSLIVGITLPARAENAFFYRLFNSVKANQLLVITEPNCRWCRALYPHLKQLKKEGYNVHTYTRSEWNRAKSKPVSLPKAILTDRYSIPVVLYVQANEVVRSHYGGKNIKYIKRYLTK